MSDSERAAALAEPEEDVLVAELEDDDCDTAPVDDPEALEATLVAEEPETASAPGTQPEAVDEGPDGGASPAEAAAAAAKAARESDDGREAPSFDRRAYLEPFVDPIASALEATEVGDDDDLVLRFAGEPVAVSAWARGVALGVLGSAEARETSAYRIVESLALEAKIKEDLARVALFQKALNPDASQQKEPVRADFDEAGESGEQDEPEAPKPEPPPHLRDELIHNAALGLALMSELQRVIDSAVVNGNMELAKNLTSFKPALNHALNDARELLDPVSLEAAQAKSQTLIEVPSDAELPEIRRKRRRRRRMQISDEELEAATSRRLDLEPAHNPRRVRLMATALVASILVWMALMAPRWFEEKQRVFTMDDFGRLPSVEKVVARPPSLFVTLDTAAWLKLKERERRDLVDEIAFSLSRAGYTGARFATADGKTVAQWLKSRGVELKNPHQSSQ